MMMKLCLMASHGYPPCTTTSSISSNPGFVLHQEHDISRVIKDFHQPFISSHAVRQDLMRSASLNIGATQVEEPWKSTSGLPNSDQLISIDDAIRKPLFFDTQDPRLDSLFFGHGIAENYTRHENISQFLMSAGSSELDEDAVDLSVLSDLMQSQASAFDVHQQPIASSLVFPNTESLDGKPFVDFLGEMALDSKLKYHPDGRVLFTGSKTEMKDFLSVVAEFYLTKNSNTCRKQEMVVPYFGWKRPAKIEAATVAPLKSNEKTKKLRKKKIYKAGKESDIYKRNNFHACESLLSLMLNKGQDRKTAVLSLKKSGPEVPQLLNQFSATIAGTGLAVIFSIICKLAFGRVTFTSSRVLSTGMGVVLVWLSWAVNKLRDTIVHISKNASKMSLKDDEMMYQVDRSVKSIYLGGAALMAVIVLRIA
ncbi:hypothetical protein ACFE04_031829 [Oxalis oulophora]